MTTRRSFALALTCGALLLAAPASALLVTVEFAGEVTVLSADQGLFGLGTTVGSPFTGRFSYETGATNPDQDPGNPNLGAYDLLSFEIDQASIGLTPAGIAVIRREPMNNVPPQPPSPGADVLLVSFDTANYPSRRGLILEGSFGSVFPDDSLPTSIDLSDFDLLQAVVGVFAVGVAPNPSIEDVGMITSLSVTVPEPGISLLMGAMVAVPALARRRSRH